MATFFETAKRSFKTVTVADDSSINTSEFLEASESVVQLFDLLGSVAFKAVQSDMTGNIKKIRDRQLAAPLKSETLQALIAAEIAENKKTATEGLLWLNRGLHFTSHALRRNHTTTTEELGVSFTNAYESTLKQHHGFIARSAFSVAMKACPYRNTFYSKLGNDENVVRQELGEWLGALENIVTILNKHYDQEVSTKIKL